MHSAKNCVGGWAPNSETPPWGWFPTILIGAAVAALFIGGVSYIGIAVGLT